MSRVGRTVVTSAVRPSGLTTASAYSAYDAAGNTFEIPYAVGEQGSLLANVLVFDYSTANASMRLHLFSRPPSGQVDGVTWTLAAADRDAYLGHVNFSTWVTAGALMNMAQASDVALPLQSTPYSGTANRSVYGQFSIVAGTFGASANPIFVQLGTIQD